MSYVVRFGLPTNPNIPGDNGIWFARFEVCFPGSPPSLLPCKAGMFTTFETAEEAETTLVSSINRPLRITNTQIVEHN